MHKFLQILIHRINAIVHEIASPQTRVYGFDCPVAIYTYIYVYIYIYIYIYINLEYNPLFKQVLLNVIAP